MERKNRNNVNEAKMLIACIDYYHKNITRTYLILVIYSSKAFDSMLAE